MDYFFCDYPSGDIEARFSHAAEYDFINLDIRMVGDIVTVPECDEQNGRAELIRQGVTLDFMVRMSSVMCAFKDFIRFLEAITVEVQECAFEWDGEGPDGRMHWSRHRVHDSGFLTVEWDASENSFTHGMRLNTRQTVKVLYSAFRAFVESPDYDPIRYEVLSHGEIFELMLSNFSLDHLGDTLVAMSADAAENALLRLRNAIDDRLVKGPKLSFPIEHFIQAPAPGTPSAEHDVWIDPEWSTWDIDRRKTHLKQLFSWKGLGWYGENLREMRSTLIEDRVAGRIPDRRFTRT